MSPLAHQGVDRVIKGDEAVEEKVNEFLAAAFTKADEEEIPVSRAFLTGNYRMT